MSLRLALLLLFAIPALAQSPLWSQCSGAGWAGANSCESGALCVKAADGYGQCRPEAEKRSPTSTSTDATTCAAIPASIPTTAIAKLPDPFKTLAGTRVTTKDDFECRRAEINALFQKFELGTMPGKPESVTATYSGGKFTINVSDGGKSISFQATVSLPSGGSGPYPAIIAYGGMSIPRPNNVAVVTFNNDDMAAQQDTSSRGKGKFYNLYGSGHSASAMMAWAWGVSRIMDAIESTPAANIDPKRVGVTGCSRNGKGAFMAGAFEPRIALTIPQESGSGGSACWRLSDSQKKNGQNVQTASEIVGENVWFSKSFEAFSNSVPNLPVDHHMLAALTVPRGLFVIENTSMEWLGASSTYECQTVGHKIYQAYGVPDNMGYSQVGNHNHCQFPSSQQNDLTAFINKFLLNTDGNTAIMKTDGNFNFQESQWVDWDTPTLT